MANTRGRAWAREELIHALDLYTRTTFVKIDRKNPEIIELARSLGRTPNSVALKLANFASIDPTLDRKGASNYSKLDVQIWNEFLQDADEILNTGTAAVDGHEQRAIYHAQTKQGEDKERLTSVRMGQNYFRKIILESYRYKCCITRMNIEKLLVASHIEPWSENKQNRLNPHNGLCLNALHDKAFDRGLITIDEKYRVVLSTELKHHDIKGTEFIQKTEGKPIQMPQHFKPKQEFLEYHRNAVFMP